MVKIHFLVCRWSFSHCVFTWQRESISLVSLTRAWTPVMKAPSLWPSSVQLFSCSVMSDSLWSQALQLARLPCPSPTPRAYLNSCPSSRWCHRTISLSVVPFSPNLHSFPASACFSMSQFFTSGGQSIEISASASVLPTNIQDWFRKSVGSPCSPKDSQESSSTPQFKSIDSSTFSFLYSPTLTSIHDYWKNHSFD